MSLLKEHEINKWQYRGGIGESRRLVVYVGCRAKASASLPVPHANWGIQGSPHSLCGLPPRGLHVASVKWADTQPHMQAHTCTHTPSSLGLSGSV